MALLPSHTAKVLPETTSMAGTSHCSRPGLRTPPAGHPTNEAWGLATFCNLQLPPFHTKAACSAAQQLYHSTCSMFQLHLQATDARPHPSLPFSPFTAARMPQAGRHNCAVAAGLGCCASNRSSAPTLLIARGTTHTGTNTHQAPSTAAAAYTCTAGTAVSATPSSYF